MIRYYLPFSSEYNSICLENITIYKDKEKNILLFEINNKLQKYVDNNIICFEELDNQGNILIKKYNINNTNTIDNNIDNVFEEEKIDIVKRKKIKK